MVLEQANQNRSQGFVWSRPRGHLRDLFLEKFNDVAAFAVLLYSSTWTFFRLPFSKLIRFSFKKFVDLLQLLSVVEQAGLLCPPCC